MSANANKEKWNEIMDFVKHQAIVNFDNLAMATPKLKKMLENYNDLDVYFNIKGNPETLMINRNLMGQIYTKFLDTHVQLNSKYDHVMIVRDDLRFDFIYLKTEDFNNKIKEGLLELI